MGVREARNPADTGKPGRPSAVHLLEQLRGLPETVGLVLSCPPTLLVVPEDSLFVSLKA